MKAGSEIWIKAVIISYRPDTKKVYAKVEAHLGSEMADWFEEGQYSLFATKLKPEEKCCCGKIELKAGVQVIGNVAHCKTKPCYITDKPQLSAEEKECEHEWRGDTESNWYQCIKCGVNGESKPEPLKRIEEEKEPHHFANIGKPIEELKELEVFWDFEGKTGRNTVTVEDYNKLVRAIKQINGERERDDNMRTLKVILAILFDTGILYFWSWWYGFMSSYCLNWWSAPTFFLGVIWSIIIGLFVTAILVTEVK